MRTFLTLAAVSLFFAGCPSKRTTPAPSPPTPSPEQPTPAPAQPTPTATPTISPEAAEPVATPAITAEPTATPAITPQDTEPTAVIAPDPPRNKVSYEGIWTTADGQGQVFDIVIFPNGQAVTNWAKGTEGARGERGYWRQDQQRLTAIYSDGTTDIIEPDGSEFKHQRYSAGSPLDSQPTSRAEVKRAEGGQFALVGVWRLNKEPDGTHLYIAIQSNGRAVSTINGGTEGKWKANERGALCEWPDGWVDQIERGTAGWQKRSWIGAESNAPADLSLATRVGEARFSVEP
jgi:hypothetical protein